MSDGQADFATLIARFAGLGRHDRRAVMAALTPEERVQVLAAIEAEDAARACEELRRRQADRQFLAYSPEVAERIEAAVKGTSAELAPRAAEALRLAHEQLRADAPTPARSGLPGLLDRLTALVGPPRSAA